MTNVNVNEILNSYTTEEQEYIISTMRFAALLGASQAPQTDEEFKSFCEETLKERHERAEKETAKKAKAEKREQEKAKALGMTVEEYRAHKKLQAKIRRYEKEIAEAETEIKKLQREIARKKQFIENMEKKEG